MGEGHKRQIREICAKFALPAVRILRIRIGSLRLGILKPRQRQYLTTIEIKGLKQRVKPNRHKVLISKPWEGTVFKKTANE